ncbi:16765_t:CDS:10, partial [Acaulospora colombiana]
LAMHHGGPPTSSQKWLSHGTFKVCLSLCKANYNMEPKATSLYATQLLSRHAAPVVLSGDHLGISYSDENGADPNEIFLAVLAVLARVERAMAVGDSIQRLSIDHPPLLYLLCPLLLLSTSLPIPHLESTVHLASSLKHRADPDEFDHPFRFLMSSKKIAVLSVLATALGVSGQCACSPLALHSPPSLPMLVPCPFSRPAINLLTLQTGPQQPSPDHGTRPSRSVSSSIRIIVSVTEFSFLPFSLQNNFLSGRTSVSIPVRATGTNQCGTANNDTSLCQNVYVNNIKDFCLWGPQQPNSGSDVATANLDEALVSSRRALSTLLISSRRPTISRSLVLATFKISTLPLVMQEESWIPTALVRHFSVMITLSHSLTDGLGNPHGGLVFTNHWNNGTNGLGEQIHEWTNFMSVNEYCIRVCKEGPGAAMWCQHIYDVTGCKWNMPGNYDDGFTSCKGDSPMGLYPQADGSTSTFHQGEGATPPPTYDSSTLYATATPTPTTTVSTTGSRPVSSGPAPTNSGSTGAGVQGVAAMPFMMATSLIGLVVALGIIF